MKITTRAELTVALAQLETFIAVGRSAYNSREQALKDANGNINDPVYRAARQAYADAAHDVITLRKEIITADFTDMGGDMVGKMDERPDFARQLIEFTGLAYTGDPQLSTKRGEVESVDVVAMKR